MEAWAAARAEAERRWGEITAAAAAEEAEAEAGAGAEAEGLAITGGKQRLRISLDAPLLGKGAPGRWRWWCEGGMGGQAQGAGECVCVFDGNLD